eukprot:1072968-Pyramimonas_sp.AAC.1
MSSRGETQRQTNLGREFRVRGSEPAGSEPAGEFRFAEECEVTAVGGEFTPAGSRSTAAGGARWYCTWRCWATGVLTGGSAARSVGAAPLSSGRGVGGAAATTDGGGGIAALRQAEDGVRSATWRQ